MLKYTNLYINTVTHEEKILKCHSILNKEQKNNKTKIRKPV